MSNPVGWFEIYVQDMARAAAFYEAVFQIKLDMLPSPDAGEFPDLEMWAFPMQQGGMGITGALVKIPGCSSGGGTLVYFICADCAVEAAKAVQAGGQLHKEKMSIGQYGHIGWWSTAKAT